MNNKKSKFGLTNAVAIVALIILGIAVLYSACIIVFGGIDGFVDLFRKDEPKERVQMVIRIDEFDTSVYSVSIDKSGNVTCSFLSVGDNVYLNGECIGTVSAVTCKDDVRSTQRVDDGGNLLYAAYPDSVDLFVYVDADVNVNNGTYSVADTDLQNGNSFVLSTKYFEMAGTIDSIAVQTAQ